MQARALKNENTKNKAGPMHLLAPAKQKKEKLKTGSKHNNACKQNKHENNQIEKIQMPKTHIQL